MAIKRLRMCVCGAHRRINRNCKNRSCSLSSSCLDCNNSKRSGKHNKDNLYSTRDVQKCFDTLQVSKHFCTSLVEYYDFIERSLLRYLQKSLMSEVDQEC